MLHFEDAGDDQDLAVFSRIRADEFGVFRSLDITDVISLKIEHLHDVLRILIHDALVFIPGLIVSKIEIVQLLFDVFRHDVVEKKSHEYTITDDNVLADGAVVEFFSLGDMRLDLGS